MSLAEQKQRAANAAIEYIKPGDIVGVGTGSTVNFFIESLTKVKARIDGAVASSTTTQAKLEQTGIPVIDLNHTNDLPIYVDGADQTDRQLRLIKGGGGALTREKIIAQASRKFICIADQSKLVDVLGRFPLPIEVIPMAQSLVARKLVAMGGVPTLRSGKDQKDFITDNGNIILDVRNLNMIDPVALETQINQIPGVVAVGLFALRPADVLLLGTDTTVKSLSPSSTTTPS